MSGAKAAGAWRWPPNAI